MAFLSAVTAASGCSCREVSLCDMLTRPIVFVGEVIAGGVAPGQSGEHVKQMRFRVIERFRGMGPGTREVTVRFQHVPMCSSVPYQQGGRYLMTLGEQLLEGACHSGREVSEVAGLLTALRDRIARPRIEITGYAAAMGVDDPFVETHLKFRSATPLAGAQIKASRNGETYTAFTDAEGKYRLPLPANGTYAFTGVLAPYQFRGLPEVRVQNDCAIHDAPLYVPNAISGRLLENGKPIDGEVALFRAEDPTAPPVRVTHTYSSPPIFRFQSVPPGRYRVSARRVGAGEPPRCPQVIEAGSQSELKGIDIHLTPQRQ